MAFKSKITYKDTAVRMVNLFKQAM